MHANHMKAIAKLAGGMLFLLPGILLPSRSFSAEKPIELGVTLPLTGADAEDAKLVEQGFAMAIDEANEKHEISGYRLELRILSTSTVTSGQVRSGAGGDRCQDADRRILRWSPISART